MSTVFAYTDYATAPNTKIHLGALTSLIVPEKVRDFSDEIYEVFHCLVDDVEPALTRIVSTTWAALCAKTCEHGKDPVPNYLANCNIVTFEGRTQVRAVGKVLQDMLEV